MSFYTSVFCAQTKCTKTRAQIRRYDAADVFKSLNSHEQELVLDHTVGIWEQSVLEEAEKPESEPREGTMTVWKLAEGL
jgi:hypothetical protein